MKIGILYICIGKYEIFWKDFYLSCEQKFIPGVQKEYYIFTDAERIEFEGQVNNIHRIKQNNLGWPGNTLLRFDMFLRIEKPLLEMDYIFFFNANLIFLEEITAKEFLSHNNENLVAVLHPGYINKKRRIYKYETNPNSLAFIDKDEGEYYFAGGIMGGRTTLFLEAVKKIHNNIKTDNDKGIVAVWHDESHWNRYLIGRNDVVILPPEYLYPERANLGLCKKIIVRDKRGFGGHELMRGQKEKFYKKIYYFIGGVLHRVKSLLKI